MLRKEQPRVGGPAASLGSVLDDSGPLTRCVGVDPDTFAAQYWGRRPLLTAAAGGSDFADLFSPEAVDELVSRRGLRTPFLRMARNGSVLPEKSFTRSGGSGAGIADQVSDDGVLAQLAAGATLVLQALHRTWPPLVEFGSALAAQLGHPVQINSYITPAENQGFSAHYDTHDVFVLQIAGSKRWIIHEPVLVDPLPSQPWDRRKAAVAARAQETPLIETVMRPGDALYLPRGFLHAASAQGELSIHLTVGVHPITGYRLVEQLLDALREDPAIRRSLPAGVDLADPEVLAASLREVAELVVQAARDPQHQLAAVAAAVSGDLNAAMRPAPISPLAQLAVAAAANADTQVRQRPGLRRTFRSAGESVLIRCLDKTLTMPTAMEPALRVLLDGAGHTASELPDLTEDEQLVLVRRLLREGVLVPVRDADLA